MPSRFALEAVYAGKGDALILHHGTTANPRWILIDGGHHGVYENYLRPRLDQLRVEFAAKLRDSGKLPLDLVMLSHADQDHVKGLLELKRHMEADNPALDEPPVEFDAMWINGFDDVVFDIPENRSAAENQSLVQAMGTDRGSGVLPLLSDEALRDEEVSAWIASTGECRELRDFATGPAQIDINVQFHGDLVRRDAPNTPSSFKIAPGLKFTVLGPDQKRIDKLRAQWKKDLRKILKREQNKTQAFKDNSKHNLSSIMVMAERGGKRMLLTGDGRGDHLEEGLKEQGFLVDGRVHVDLFKLPHHGSDRNVEQSTFEKIIADHYVISANGEHHNPETATLDMLVDGRAAADANTDFRVHFTFPDRAFEKISQEDVENSPSKAKQREALKAVNDWLRDRKAKHDKDGTHDHLIPVFRDLERFGVTVDLLP